MKASKIIKQAAETFVIASLSTLFGYIGAHYYKDNFIIPSLISGVGGMIGLLLFSFPDLSTKGTESISKNYGQWTQMMRKECLRFRKKAIISFLISSVIIVVASSVIFYSIRCFIAEYNGTAKTPQLVALGFLASLFGIFYTITVRRLTFKMNIREYTKYKKACMNNAHGL